MKNKFINNSPNIVALGGGTGLSTLLSGLKIYTRNITAIVAVTDEGGSSGRIRQEWGMLPPGDIRNCIVALAENDNSLNRLLNFRFDRGELKGHSLGNLILLAITEMFGDFYLAVKELNKLLAIRGQVLPVSTESLTLKGEIKETLQVISGELEISNNGSQLSRLWVEPLTAEPIPETLQAIEEADVITLGPGSLFTSILPNLLMKKLTLKIRESSAPIVYIANLMTQPRETEGMNIVAHIDWIVGILGRVPDYILTNHTVIPEKVFESYKKIKSEPLYLSEKEEAYLSSLGSKLIYGDFLAINKDGHIRHNVQNLSKAIIEIATQNLNKGKN
ncbi:MAG: YvcK family protein [Synergistaceae bacterium]